jgi:poly-D-alanine transfer protein DltD
LPTPQEKAAQTRERKKLEAEQKRLEEEELELVAQRERADELRQALRIKRAYGMLVSEVTGLYDEMDKLAKKAPNEPVTTLQLKVINSFIKKAKRLLSGDTIVDEVEVFVAAGDNPEYRDTVTVLRQIRQGLERFENVDFVFTGAFDEELLEHEIDDDEDLSDYFAVTDSENGAAE